MNKKIETTLLVTCTTDYSIYIKINDGGYSEISYDAIDSSNNIRKILYNSTIFFKK
jgi:hypothetical protein